MKGKILADGVIVGSDENRYSYDESEVRSESVLRVGDEVDFIVSEGEATQIYFLKPSSTALNIGISNDAKGASKLGVIGCILSIFVIVPYIGIFFALAGWICILFAMFKVADLSGSKTIKPNYIKSMIFGGIAMSLIMIGSGMLAAMAFIGSSPMSVTAMLLIIAGFGVGMYGWMKYWATYKEMAILTENKFFTYQAICYIAGSVTIVFFIGYFVLIVAAGLQLYAWLKVEKINKAI